MFVRPHDYTKKLFPAFLGDENENVRTNEIRFYLVLFHGFSLDKLLARVPLQRVGISKKNILMDKKPQ